MSGLLTRETIDELLRKGWRLGPLTNKNGLLTVTLVPPEESDETNQG